MFSFTSHAEFMKDGLKHMRLKFYIEGDEPGRKGTVHSESKEVILLTSLSLIILLMSLCLLKQDFHTELVLETEAKPRVMYSNVLTHFWQK